MEISTKEDAVLTILKELDARHEEVIRMYFGLGRDSKTSIEEIGQDFDLTIDKVIELQPNLAIAYARRGTIYYYLNDTKSASMNWNIALKLDPEYDQVREILKGLKEGTVEPIYKNNNDEE